MPNLEWPTQTKRNKFIILLCGEGEKPNIAVFHPLCLFYQILPVLLKSTKKIYVY